MEGALEAHLRARWGRVGGALKAHLSECLGVRLGRV
jgi:hypothetical protein